MAALLFLVLIGCNEVPKEKVAGSRLTKSTKTNCGKDLCPLRLGSIFQAHGGYEAWKEHKTLSYEIEEGETNEIHVIDLAKGKDGITIGDTHIRF